MKFVIIKNVNLKIGQIQKSQKYKLLGNAETHTRIVKNVCKIKF